MTAVNHPPTPALEGLDVAIQDPADCAALKAKYEVETGKHGSNDKGGEVQSHHIFQNAAMKNASGGRIISTYSGHAVMLMGGSHDAGSEHDIANKRQAARSRDAWKEANPRPTFGEIKKWAKGDLKAAFKDGKAREGITDAEAEMLADCVTTEAVEALQSYRKAKKKPRLNDDNRVTNPRGCFTPGTLLWTPAGPRPVEELACGDALLGPEGAQLVTRIEACFNTIVELELDGERLSLSATHRVQLASGRQIAAGSLRAGHELATRAGAAALVLDARPRPECGWIIGVGVSSPSAAFIGDAGLIVELVDSGPPIRARVDLSALPELPFTLTPPTS